MKQIIFAVTSFFLVSKVYAGDPGACYSIQNSDSRNYCLAKAHNDSSRCYSIQSSEKRSECLAELK